MSRSWFFLGTLFCTFWGRKSRRD